jgi:hypothetical protein
MEPPKPNPPMVDYVVKLMLLEAVNCYQVGNTFGLQWLERQMFRMKVRLEELRKLDG